MKGHLLGLMGDLDQNALPGSTLQLVDAFIKANKEFDLIYLPSKDHAFGYNDYPRRRICDFFVRHLLGTTPPDWNAMALVEARRANPQ